MVDGTDIYWEARGDGGTPLGVVHGGFWTVSLETELLDALARDRRVVAIELRGHGHTALGDRPFSWEDCGEQVAGVVRGLGLGPCDLLGYSLGAGACLRAAIAHPDLVRRLVVVSIPFARNGNHPDVLANMEHVGSGGLAGMQQTPLYAAYAAVAPAVDDFAALMDRIGELLRTPYDWADEVAALPMPVQLVFGDADSVPPAHAAEFFGLLGGGRRDGSWDRSGVTAHRLALLPGVTHYEIFDARLAPMVGEFLG